MTEIEENNLTSILEISNLFQNVQNKIDDHIEYFENEGLENLIKNYNVILW